MSACPTLWYRGTGDNGKRNGTGIPIREMMSIQRPIGVMVWVWAGEGECKGVRTDGLISIDDADFGQVYLLVHTALFAAEQRILDVICP